VYQNHIFFIKHVLIRVKINEIMKI